MLVTLSLLALVTSQAPAGGTRTASCMVPMHGVLQFSVPAAWRVACKSISAPAGASVELRPESGSEAFKVLITAVYRGGKARPGSKELKKIAESTLEKARPNAVETEIPLEELKGPSVVGWAFRTTDKAPTGGDYPFMLQAAMTVKELLLVVTVLYRDEGKAELDRVLEVLKNGMQTKL